MPQRYLRRILEHVTDPRYRPRRLAELADELGIAPEERPEFNAAVDRLLEEGQVLHSSSETIVLPPPGRMMIGTFRKNERGFGFIIPDPDRRTGHGDLFVPAFHTADAMTGDRVRARVLHREDRAGGSKSPYVGQIVEILQRADRHYVGVLQRTPGGWQVIVDGNVIHQPVVVRDPGAKDAKAGDKVVIELIRYPDADTLPEGVILEVLGEHGEPEVETVAVMRAFGLPERFAPEVTQDARDAALRFDPGKLPPGRTDFSRDLIFTIDPPDARDFDDAIGVRRLNPSDESDGAAWELQVHIADVSFFVLPGSVLDLEASKRGNSTYLPRRVIPMLPETLSNGVCSLQEAVPRLTKSVTIRFDAQAKVLDARFAAGIIRSRKRLTYLEAQALIDGDVNEARKHAKEKPSYPDDLLAALRHANELSKLIHQRRRRAGMIELDLPEVELIYDDSGRVIDAQPEDCAYTHKLIEMFMVEANEAAARLFDSLNVPMIRRIHPDPSAHDIGDLQAFARVAGYNIPLKPKRSDLQRLLDAVRGKPAQQAVHFAVLRTLAKAEYAPLIIGHFALASEHYTHFTSPIRRYADLIVHRALDAYLDHAHEGGRRKGKLGDALRDDPRIPDEGKLQDVSRHISGTERNSEAAERELRRFLVMQLLADHLGEDFDGTVTGVTAAGVFVQIDKYLVDGFIRASDLPATPGDQWRFNRLTGALVAQRSGRIITIGQSLRVRIAKVDPSSRKLDLVVVNADGQVTKTIPRKQPPGARRAHQQTSRMKQTKNKTKPHRGKRR